jgi:hypothetical protein
MDYFVWLKDRQQVFERKSGLKEIKRFCTFDLNLMADDGVTD